MSLFGKVLKSVSSSDTGFEESWVELNNLSQIDEAIEASKSKVVAIYKHSTTCSISAMAKHRLAKMELPESDKLEFYYLDLLAHRDISNEIAVRLRVRHESPQLLLLKDGKAVEAVSHGRVRAEVLREYLTA